MKIEPRSGNFLSLCLSFVNSRMKLVSPFAAVLVSAISSNVYGQSKTTSTKSSPSPTPAVSMIGGKCGGMLFPRPICGAGLYCDYTGAFYDSPGVCRKDGCVSKSNCNPKLVEICNVDSKCQRAPSSAGGQCCTKYCSFNWSCKAGLACINETIPHQYGTCGAKTSTKTTSTKTTSTTTKTTSTTTKSSTLTKSSTTLTPPIKNRGESCGGMIWPQPICNQGLFCDFTGSFPDGPGVCRDSNCTSDLTCVSATEVCNESQCRRMPSDIGGQCCDQFCNKWSCKAGLTCANEVNHGYGTCISP